MTEFQFRAFDDTEGVPNVVIDGSPNGSTVLTLTHWPGIAQPAGLAADLSAEMAFKYLDAAPQHNPAQFVTNNHFGGQAVANAIDVLALLRGERVPAPEELVHSFPHLEPVTRVEGQGRLFG